MSSPSDSCPTCGQHADLTKLTLDKPCGQDDGLTERKVDKHSLIRLVLDKPCCSWHTDIAIAELRPFWGISFKLDELLTQFRGKRLTSIWESVYSCPRCDTCGRIIQDEDNGYCPICSHSCPTCGQHHPVANLLQYRLDKPFCGGRGPFHVWTNLPRAFAYRSVKERQQEAERKGKVEGPYSAEVMYRMTFGNLACKLVGEKARDIVRACNNSWEMEDEDTRAEFRNLASYDKLNHEEAFPACDQDVKDQRKEMKEFAQQLEGQNKDSHEEALPISDQDLKDERKKMKEFAQDRWLCGSAKIQRLVG
jgi:hypothetical protein